MQLRMKRKTFSFLLATLVAGSLFVGCKEKPVTTPGDLENPTIVMTSPVEVPSSSPIQIMSTDSFQVDISFADDKELRDWEITIRFEPTLDYARTAVSPWKETWYGDLDGMSGGVNFHEFVIYDPTAGYYVFKVKVTDMAGKTAERTTYFYVKNRLDLVGPTIVYQDPDTSRIDTFAIGNPMHIRAIVSESPGELLSNVTLRVRDKVTKNLMENSYVFWDTVFVTQFVIDTNLNVPAGTVPGNYNVEVYGNDFTNNVRMKTCEVYIKPN